MSFYCLMCKSFVRLAAELSFSLCGRVCVCVCHHVYWCVNFHYIVKLLHIL